MPWIKVPYRCGGCGTTGKAKVYLPPVDALRVPDNLPAALAPHCEACKPSAPLAWSVSGHLMGGAS